MAKHEMEERFERFALTLPGAESIDALNLDSAGGPRADYLWRERSVVVEVKILRGDPQEKSDGMFEQLGKRDDFPIFYGPAPADKVLANLPDGDDLLRKLHEKVSRAIEKNFRDAKYQIDNTKKLLGLPDALGILVLLNPDVEAHDPINVGKFVSEMMIKHTPPVAIDVVWLISEAHFLGQGMPCILITSERMERLPWADSWLSGLNERWAEFNNSRLFTSDAQQLAHMPFQRKSERPSGPLTNQQRWEASYLANPYLADLNDDQLRAFGHKAATDLLPYFTKGGPRLPFADLDPIAQRWAHFLVEAARRGLDIRGMGM